jgi:galactokinase/mevalonate kinase-like predicted kinase
MRREKKKKEESEEQQKQIKSNIHPLSLAVCCCFRNHINHHLDHLWKQKKKISVE